MKFENLINNLTNSTKNFDEKTRVGNIAPEISLNSPDGNILKLFCFWSWFHR